ncbi:HVO_2922 family protein [Halobaculum sp. MBLA0147]|uniref:HVO_2922 family protein n=1 Tax=Halobaculum sp. MBLA0147 TaxID=3079934 RepID=UPI0035261115
MASTFELYRDEADEWRWRLRHDNGNVIADSGQGYSDKSGATDGIESVRRDAADAEIEEVDG